MLTLKEHLIQHLNLENPDQELTEALGFLGQELFNHRLKNFGYTPNGIFTACLAIGGTCVGFEVVVKTMENGYAKYFLKRRDSSQEQGWGGFLHIVGTVIRITDHPSDLLDRLSVEIFGVSGKLNWSNLEKIGDAIYDESQEGKGDRLSLAPTLMFLHTIDQSQVAELTKGWEEVKDLNDPDIIKFHSDALKWVDEGPSRAPVVRF